MDDALVALEQFERALRTFNEEVRRSRRDVERHMEVVATTWRDSSREEFDRRWHEIDDPMAAYVQRDAQAYETFVADRIQRLRRYLHGR